MARFGGGGCIDLSRVRFTLALGTFDEESLSDEDGLWITIPFVLCVVPWPVVVSSSKSLKKNPIKAQ